MLHRSFENCTLAETEALARVAARHLRPGDCVLLTGEIGTGKSHFARTAIQALLARFALVEDVPSPTYTLVQTYHTPEFDIWHADLYRLSDGGELDELGLTDAWQDGVCLIEWPERADGVWPERHLKIGFAIDPANHDNRTINISFVGEWEWANTLKL